MRKRKLTLFATWISFPMIIGIMIWFPLSLPGSENNPQGTGNLKGFIYKSDGKTPLWGAQLLLKDMKTGEIFESNVTDAVGDYKFLDIPEGDYTVKIQVKDKNYKVKTVDFMIKIFDGKTTTLSFSLKKYRKYPLILGLRLCHIIAFLAGIATIGVVVL